MNQPKLRERIERAYRAITGAEDERGAMSWFATEVGKYPSTVGRWMSGEHPIDAASLEKLEKIERDAADKVRREAGETADALLAAQADGEK